MKLPGESPRCQPRVPHCFAAGESTHYSLRSFSKHAASRGACVPIDYAESRHKAHILNAIRFGISNARIEATNNKIKLIIRKPYGFRISKYAGYGVSLMLRFTDPTIKPKTY